MRKRIAVFAVVLLTFCSAAVWAGYGAITCQLKKGYVVSTDTVFSIVDHASNTNSQPITRWMVEAYGDTVDFTFASPEGNFSWRISPGDSADAWNKHSLKSWEVFGDREVPITAVTIDRKTTSAEAQFIGVYRR